jgi:cell division septation protein DedD
VTHFLRHTAVCLWVSLLLTGGVGLWLLPALQAAVGLEAIPFAAAGMLAAMFVGVGWAAGRLGLGQVRRHLRSAEQAERDGQPAEAEAELRDALAVLDRFWVSASTRRRSALVIAARLARLYLARGRLDLRGAALVEAYLMQVPADEEVAESWAAQAEQRGGLTEDQQELAGRLARRYPENAVITRTAARLYLLLERTDYDALQCYRRVCDTRGLPPDELRADVDRVLGRADVAENPTRPAAHSVTLDAAAQAPVQPVDRAEERGGPSPVCDGADDPEPRFRMTAQADAEDEEAQRPARPTAGAMAGRFLRAAWAGLSGRCRASAARMPAILSATQALWRVLPFRHVLGAAMVAGLGALLVWLVATAMEDYFSRATETPAPAEAPAVAAPPAITDDPYTLQVAAYLKQEYALKRVEDLKGKGLDAYWTETSSGGKVYYQVRISHFRDQQSARDFGRSLKDKGVIKDFYVTNYVR